MRGGGGGDDVQLGIDCGGHVQLILVTVGCSWELTVVVMFSSFW